MKKNASQLPLKAFSFIYYDQVLNNLCIYYVMLIISVKQNAFPSITTYVVYEQYSITQDKESMANKFCND
jgi:hypothetical protein